MNILSDRRVIPGSGGCSALWILPQNELTEPSQYWGRTAAEVFFLTDWVCCDRVVFTGRHTCSIWKRRPLGQHSGIFHCDLEYEKNKICLLYILFCYLFICEYRIYICHMCGGHRTMYSSWFFLFTMWVLRMELRSPGLATGTLTCWTILLAQVTFFINFYYNFYRMFLQAIVVSMITKISWSAFCEDFIFHSLHFLSSISFSFLA